jgi:hypothetical protein
VGIIHHHQERPHMNIDDPMAAVISAGIAAVASILAALIANRAQNTSNAIKRHMAIRQVRMDERDLILAEGGFLIPIDKNDLWRDYYDKRTRDVSRKDASLSIKDRIPRATDELVKEKISE